MQADKEVLVKFSPPNPFGILNHWVYLSGENEVYVPMRVIHAGAHAVVTLTLLRRPGMSDAAFAKDYDAIQDDLLTLKQRLESR